MNANMANDIKLLGSVHLTESNSVQLVMAVSLRLTKNAERKKTRNTCPSCVVVVVVDNVARLARLPLILCYWCSVATCWNDIYIVFVIENRVKINGRTEQGPAGWLRHSHHAEISGSKKLKEKPNPKQ